MLFYKPLPLTSSGRKFEVRSKVLGVYDKGKATVMETEQAVVDANTGEVYSKVIGSGFFVGQGGWGGPKGEKGPDYSPPRDKTPDVTMEMQTSAETAHLYRLNGDYNPLHATPEPGQKMGFGGAIMHGLYSWNVGAHHLLKAFGGSDGARLQSYEARFASPVKPGEKLVYEMWKTGRKEEGAEEIVFVAKTGAGKVALSNGRALVRTEGARSKL
ncbi:MAG: hypothetical protein Q9162_007636 [Coniocarpon cinnabarinum]